MDYPTFEGPFKIVLVNTDDTLRPMHHKEVCLCGKCGALVLWDMIHSHTEHHMHNDIEVDTGDMK